MAITPDDYEKIYIGDPGMENSVKISSNLAYELRASFIEFLEDNVDFFAWKPKNMPGINHEIISHELCVDHTRKPIQQ